MANPDSVHSIWMTNWSALSGVLPNYDRLPSDAAWMPTLATQLCDPIARIAQNVPRENGTGASSPIPECSYIDKKKDGLVVKPVFLFWRRHPDLNRGMEVLQTSALPLGYAAISRVPILSY